VDKRGIHDKHKKSKINRIKKRKKKFQSRTDGKSWITRTKSTAQSFFKTLEGRKIQNKRKGILFNRLTGTRPWTLTGN